MCYKYKQTNYYLGASKIVLNNGVILFKFFSNYNVIKLKTIKDF